MESPKTEKSPPKPRGALLNYHAKWPVRQAKIAFIVVEGRMTAATFAGSA